MSCPVSLAARRNMLHWPHPATSREALCGFFDTLAFECAAMPAPNAHTNQILPLIPVLQSYFDWMKMLADEGIGADNAIRPGIVVNNRKDVLRKKG